MKIQCDVCNRIGATVFCVADDAALCTACDHQVHHANKLAGKHQRFSLISPKQIPVCDICQEKRAFLFCQQDRAILCRDCDFSIHKANEHKQIHNRFLLTGIKLSIDSAVYSPSEKSETTIPVPNPNPNLITPTGYTKSPAQPGGDGGVVKNLPSSSSSNISDYLIDTLPGWHVDDFLDFSSDDFCKSGDDLMMQIGEDSSWPLENSNSGIWVPQAPPPPLHPSQYTVIPQPKVGLGMNFSKSTAKETINLGKSRKLIDDWSFAVPQISTPSSLSSKRFRFAGSP